MMLALVALVGDALRTFSERFSFSAGHKGAVFLIWGGLVIIGFVLVSFLLAPLVASERPVATPARPRVLTRVEAPPRRAGAAAAARAIERGEDLFQAGRVAGKRVEARHVDGVLDRVFKTGLGDPRILSSGPHTKLLRLHHCRSCARDPTRGRCEFERGFLSAAFENLLEGPVRVRETACRARGADDCEFEVVY